MAKHRQPPMMFLFHSVSWGYKPGHTVLDTHGLYPSWDEAFKAAMKCLMDNEWEQIGHGGHDLRLPTNKAELEAALKRGGGCVLRFEEGIHLSFWDGSDEGSNQFAIQAVRLKQAASSKKRKI